MTINIGLQRVRLFHWCKRQISPLRERETQRPVGNGRFLSPPHERQGEGELPSKVCRIKSIDAHFKPKYRRSCRCRVRFSVMYAPPTIEMHFAPGIVPPKKSRHAFLFS